MMDGGLSKEIWKECLNYSAQIFCRNTMKGNLKNVLHKLNTMERRYNGSLKNLTRSESVKEIIIKINVKKKLD